MPTTLTIADTQIAQGETCDLRLKVSESYTGDPVAIPLRVIRAPTSGPVMFIAGAVHGDEINGTGIIRELMFGPPLDLQSGTLILVPIVNSFGFETHSRYLPDRRDLNRCFPGSSRGSLAADWLTFSSARSSAAATTALICIPPPSAGRTTPTSGLI